MVELDRRAVLGAGLAGAGGLLVGGLGAGGTAVAAPRVGRTLASGLSIPWGIAFLPSGDALVSERASAAVHRVSRTGGRRRVGTVPGVRDNAGEGGLLGLAMHPQFRTNRWVYAYLTSPSDNRVVRFRFADGRIGPPQVVIAGIPSSTIHNGGRLAFGPDGLLYISTGDAARRELAQDRGSLGGKILRVTPTGEVPAGNPFGSPVWTYGHRNVQGLAFDGDGRLWATELGEKTRDELNRIVRGHNYGWPVVEGGDGSGSFHDPFVTWSPTSSCSPSGLTIARGRAWVGALQGECLFSVRIVAPNRKRIRRHLAGRFGRVRTVERAPDGSLWITTSNGSDDRVVRIVL
ncbi:MAG TPA: PQQ-dependent sugar dehydrogenase [Nocardioides sp.]|nr:PQQ-dependent sugar dehydrogenase [Nocardioides sp.]